MACEGGLSLVCGTTWERITKRAIFCSAVCWLFPDPASSGPNGYFDLQPTVALEAGGGWITDGTRYRLFGVQSFSTGAIFTNKAGEKKNRDDASRAVLAAYIKDTRPVCAPVMKVADTTTVTCYAAIGGNRQDLAMILISSGFAFAEVREDGRPLYEPYAAAEAQARERRAGLWQFISKADH